MKPFPLIGSLDRPTCWSCGLIIYSPRTSGYAPGRGALMAYCPKCKTWTYFDKKAPKKDVDMRY